MKCTVRTIQRGEQLTFGARGARRSSGEESDAIELFDRKGGLETIGAEGCAEDFLIFFLLWFGGLVGAYGLGMAAAAKGARGEIAALRHGTAEVVKVIADGAAGA